MGFEIYAFGLGVVIGLVISYLIDINSCKHDWKYIGDTKTTFYEGSIRNFRVYECQVCKKTKREEL